MLHANVQGYKLVLPRVGQASGGCWLKFSYHGDKTLTPMPNQDMAADLLTARAEMIRFYPTPKTKKELVPFLLGFTLLDEKQLKDMCLQRLRIIAMMTKIKRERPNP